jgi:uncharacterized protein (TIGR03435 family)
MAKARPHAAVVLPLLLAAAFQAVVDIVAQDTSSRFVGRKAIGHVESLIPSEAIASAMSTAASQTVDVVVLIRPCKNASNAPGYAGRGSMIGPGGTIAGWNSMRPQLSLGHVLWTCEPLTQLVFEAYAGPDQPLLNTVVLPLAGLPASVRGGPSWAYTDAFTIEAKGEIITAATLAPTLRALLEDRFQLKVRRVMEQEDVYVMTVAKGGLNTKLLQTPTPGDCLTSDQRSAAMAANPRPDPRIVPPVCESRSLHASTNEVVFSGETLQQLAAAMQGWNVDHYVIDQTGIERKFNFTMKAPNEPIFPPADPGWVIHELDQMGLKLTRTKAPAEHLQIDHAEKPRLH